MEEIKLEYNTSRDALGMYEYGRNVQEMVRELKDIPDREKRTNQAKAKKSYGAPQPAGTQPRGL